MHAEPASHAEPEPYDFVRESAPAPAPRAYVPPAPPAAFHAVSEHDAAAAAAEEEAHRPQRRRRQASDATQGEVALQLVETQAETPPLAAEDELPRRTKPRRRRGGPVEEAPLMLVETQGGTEQPDTPPTP